MLCYFDFNHGFFVFLKQTGHNVLNYVNMVCSSLRIAIPKSIVYCQVREAKRCLLDHFFAELGAKEVRFQYMRHIEIFFKIILKEVKPSWIVLK